MINVNLKRAALSDERIEKHNKRIFKRVLLPLTISLIDQRVMLDDLDRMLEIAYSAYYIDTIKTN